MSAKMGDPAVPSFAALFDDEELFGDAVTELARTGVPRSSLTIASRSAKRLDALHERYDAVPLDAGVRHTGVFAELARATGQRDAHPPDALVDELRRRGIDEERARYFDTALGEGGVLLLVPVTDSEHKHLAMLASRGANLGLANEGGLIETLPLRKELLEVTKRVVVTNEVTVRTEIIVERQTIELELTREEIVIERRDPRRPAVAAEVIRIPLKHEEAIVDKRTVVTAEVDVRTEQHVERSVLEESVRHEVLRVDDPTQATAAP